jgi:hypothetical protein
MTGDQHAIFVHQHRHREAVRGDRIGDLIDLVVRMGAGIFGVVENRVEVAALDLFATGFFIPTSLSACVL